jgi:hypothetical protein
LQVCLILGPFPTNYTWTDLSDCTDAVP